MGYASMLLEIYLSCDMSWLARFTRSLWFDLLPLNEAVRQIVTCLLEATRLSDSSEKTPHEVVMVLGRLIVSS